MIEPYWVIIGPLVLVAVGMMVRLWYVAGTVSRVAADDRGVGRDGGDLGDRR